MVDDCLKYRIDLVSRTRHASKINQVPHLDQGGLDDYNVLGTAANKRSTCRAGLQLEALVGIVLNDF